MVKQLILRIVLIYLHATTSGMTDIDYHYWVVLVKVALFCWSNSENVVWLVCIFDTLKQLIFNNKKLKQLLVHSASRIKSGKQIKKEIECCLRGQVLLFIGNDLWIWGWSKLNGYYFFKHQSYFHHSLFIQRNKHRLIYPTFC